MLLDEVSGRADQESRSRGKSRRVPVADCVLLLVQALGRPRSRAGCVRSAWSAACSMVGDEHQLDPRPAPADRVETAAPRRSMPRFSRSWVSSGHCPGIRPGPGWSGWTRSEASRSWPSYRLEGQYSSEGTAHHRIRDPARVCRGHVPNRSRCSACGSAQVGAIARRLPSPGQHSRSEAMPPST